MVQSTKNHVNCTRRVKLFLKKVQAVQFNRNEAWLKHEIMKDIEQWDPRFDVEVFNEKDYFTILKRLSLNDLEHYRKYIQPGLKKLTQTETDYLASGQEKTLMARV